MFLSLTIKRLYCKIANDFTSIRAKYWKQEKLREIKADFSKLSDKEKLIYNEHSKAVNNGYFSYEDPETNQKIWTTFKHFLNKRCCGEGCRHCIYDYESVPNVIKAKKTFNGLFWKDLDDLECNNSSLKKMFNIIKVKYRKK